MLPRIASPVVVAVRSVVASIVRFVSCVYSVVTNEDEPGFCELAATPVEGRAAMIQIMDMQANNSRVQLAMVELAKLEGWELIDHNYTPVTLCSFDSEYNIVD